MSGDARDFDNIETQALKLFFFLQEKAQKELHAILTETLGEHATSYTTVKNLVAQFKRGDFSTCNAPICICFAESDGMLNSSQEDGNTWVTT
jgi:3-methyladenine DNA glycosylase Tag